MNILSLFDGMSCGQIALKEIGIVPEKYYASEVDKHAICQTMLNFPNTVQLGDVRNVNVSTLEHIGLLIGGSPCQSFSFAGKRKGMTTTCNEEVYSLERYIELKAEGFEFEGQSYLFWEYMRILTDIRKYNPNVFFLLENVEMEAKWERVLSEAIGVFGVHINSALVSAQNRKRIYWTNIRTKQVGLFGELHTDIPQPKDQGIYLKDILEDEVNKKYYISQDVLNRIEKNSFMSPEKKANTQRNATGRCMDAKHNYQIINLDGKLKPNQDKSSCFTTGAHSGGNHSDMDLICVAMRGRNPENPSDRRAGSPTEQRLEANTTGKTNCLPSVQKDNLICIGGIINGEFKEGTSKEFSQGMRVYNENSKSTCLNSEGGGMGAKTGLYAITQRQQNNLKNTNEKATAFLSTSYKGSQANGMTLVKQSRIRRLTPTECARLQTVPDWYNWACSDTQQYKMLGNGWTIEVIKHILSFLNIN